MVIHNDLTICEQIDKNNKYSLWNLDIARIFYTHPFVVCHNLNKVLVGLLKE